MTDSAPEPKPEGTQKARFIEEGFCPLHFGIRDCRGILVEFLGGPDDGLRGWFCSADGDEPEVATDTAPPDPD